MFKFLSRLKKQWYLIVLCIICVIAQVAFDFLIPLVMGEIIKTLQGVSTKSIDVSYIAKCAAMMTFFALGSGASSIGGAKLSAVLTNSMMSQVRYELFSKISSFSIDEMNKFSTSSLITRTTNDITNISNTYVYIFKLSLYGPLTAFGALTFLILKRNAYMVFLTLGIIAILAVFLIVITKIAIPKFKEIQTKVDKVNLITKENLEGLRVVRAYNAEGYQIKKFHDVSEDLRKTESFANRVVGLIMPGIQFIVGLLTVGISWLGAIIINKNPADFKYAEITVVSEYAVLLLIGFVLMTIIFIQIPRSMVCAKRINDVLNTEVAVKDGKGVNKENNDKNDVVIEFKDVSFTYPGGELPVIEHISFKVKRGETIAFIGATGSGKSTLINLLPRFADVTTGEVIVDGHNVKDYALSELLSKFGYVPQKGYLFHKSLRENVCLGKPDATDEQFKRALEISQSSEFVSKLPNQENYEISQGGKNVSGGQRQRLCIARAIITEPEIFIFDDSFSALDYRTDKILRGEIKDKCKGVTNVIVAQRVGTIIDADQIVVLDNRTMVGIGTHKELLKNCKVYQEIALSQLSKEELSK